MNYFLEKYDRIKKIRVYATIVITRVTRVPNMTGSVIPRCSI